MLILVRSRDISLRTEDRAGSETPFQEQDWSCQNYTPLPDSYGTYLGISECWLLLKECAYQAKA
jgi:hypothetical protein